MSENGYLHLVLRELLAYAVGVVESAAGAVLLALGYYDYGAVLALSHASADELGKLVDVGLVLRNDRSLGSGSDGAVLGEEASVTAHDFDEEDTVVGVGGVADLVDTVYDGIEGGVVADCMVSTIKVVVDRARKSDYRDVVLACEELGAGQGAVAADYDEGVDVVGDHVVVGFLTAFRVQEFLAAGGLQYGTSALDRIADAGRSEFFEFAVDKAFVSSVDRYHLHIIEDGSTGDGSYAGVHSRGIPA